MKLKYYYFNIFLISIIIFFAYHLNIFLEYTMISPDSIRFMKLWQINFDKYSFIKAIFHSMKESVIYDGNRSRYMQYILYGIDVIIRKNGANNSINILSLSIIVINNILISLMITKEIKNNRFTLFIMILLLLNSTIFFYGPIIDLVLYGKMIWITFILLFFILNNKYLKIIMLFLACISDEFGLFSSLIISFTYSFFYFYSLNFSVKKIFIASFGLCLIIFSSINGINAILFNLGSGFSSFFISFGGESIRFGTIQRFDSVLIYLLNIIFGSHSYFNKIELIIIKSIILLIFIITFTKISFFYIKNLKCLDKNNTFNLINNLKINSFTIIWAFIFIFINLIANPGGGDDFSHRGYAKAIIISILLYIFLLNYFKKDGNKIILLSFFILFHTFIFIFNTNSNNSFAIRLSNYFINDNSVNWTDLKKIKESVIEYHQFNNSKTFDSINNNQEIDFSGTWYYSRISNYDTTKKSYFPVKGTVDVLIWPKKTQ
jgi:hypothetical protein